jgi:hypothetical protein
MTCFRFIATLNAFYTKQCRTEIKKPCFVARFFGSLREQGSNLRPIG